MTCVAVGSTVTPIATSGVQFSLLVKNHGPDKVFLDVIDTVTADSTTTGGYPLGPGEDTLIPGTNITDPNPYTLYGITATGDTANVAFINA